MDQAATPVDKGEQVLASVETIEVSTDKPVSVDNVGECSAVIENIGEGDPQSASVEIVEVVKEPSSSGEKGSEVGQKAASVDNVQVVSELPSSRVNAEQEDSALIERSPSPNNPSGRRFVPSRMKRIIIFGVLTTVTLILGVLGLAYGATYNDTFLFTGGSILLVFSFIFSIALQYTIGTTPFCVVTALERSSGDTSNRRVKYRSSRSRTQSDIENQVASAYADDTQTAGPSSEQTKAEKDGDCAIAEEKQPILPASNEVCTGSTISEIASAISQIASDTVVSEGSNQARGPVQSLVSSQEPNEGLSSGELRRRKFPNPEDYRDLTASSDEELTKN